MVAYSFKRQFEIPIATGRKRQTIRADRKRHARPGEELQLYSGMRTKSCRLLGRATCLSVEPVLLHLGRPAGGHRVLMPSLKHRAAGPWLDAFAQADGFDDWAGLEAFWAAQHPGIEHFEGVLIRWGDLHG